MYVSIYLGQSEDYLSIYLGQSEDMYLSIYLSMYVCMFVCFIGWGYVIRRQYICRSVTPPNEATCLPWVVTHNAWQQDPGV